MPLDIPPIPQLMPVRAIVIPDPDIADAVTMLHTNQQALLQYIIRLTNMLEKQLTPLVDVP